MAHYSTLCRFPFVVPHRTADAGGLSLPLEIVHRWYWRVRRWRTTFTMGGHSVTQEHHAWNIDQSSDHFGPITDETGLLYYCRLQADTSVGGSPDPSINGGVTFSPVDLASLGYDPATASYNTSGWQASIGVGVNGDVQLASVNDPLYPVQAQPITVSVNIDGHMTQTPGRYRWSPGDPDHPTPPPPVPACSFTAVPIKFWGWDGKFDPTTGEKP